MWGGYMMIGIARHHRRKRRKTNHSGVTMLSENSDNCSPHPVKMVPRMGYPCGGEMPPQLIGREVMYDTPPSGHDPRIMMAPPGMVLVQPGGMGHPGMAGGNAGAGMGHSAEQGWAHLNNTLTRRGTPTLFVEPPRIRDYSEYGIPPNQQQHHPHAHPHQHQSMAAVAAVSPQHQHQSMQPIPHQHQQQSMQQQQQGHPHHQQLAHLSQQNLHLHNQNLSGGYHRGDVQG